MDAMHILTGGAVSRWFGVAHDDEMETAGWQRAGTLRRNERVHSYAVIPQQDPELDPGVVELGNRRSDGENATEQPAAEDRQRQQRDDGRGRGRMDRVAATLTLRRRQRATAQEVQKSLPKFWPLATILIAISELALLIAILVQNGFAPIASKPTVVNDIIDGFGNRTEFLTREDVPNFFIGPSSSSLIHIGAKYTPVSIVSMCVACPTMSHSLNAVSMFSNTIVLY